MKNVNIHPPRWPSSSAMGGGSIPPPPAPRLVAVSSSAVSRRLLPVPKKGEPLHQHSVIFLGVGKNCKVQERSEEEAYSRVRLVPIDGGTSTDAVNNLFVGVLGLAQEIELIIET